MTKICMLTRSLGCAPAASSALTPEEIHKLVEEELARVNGKSPRTAKEKAQVRLEGKEYVVQEGDVILFRHSG